MTATASKASTRFVRACACLTLTVILALPHATLLAALASGAASVFEAMPFVLAAALFPRRRVRAFLPLFACGCGGTLPAALSLPSIALCWLTFGPWPTLARALAAVAVACVRLPRGGLEERDADPLADLLQIGLLTFAASLASEALHHVPALESGALQATLGFVAGTFAGALSPCGTAGIAAAAALRFASPSAAAGMLATAGMLSAGSLFKRASNFAARDARFALLLLAGAALVLSVRGTHGFLNPRFTLLAPAGVICAIFAALKTPRTNARVPFVIPLGLFAALIAGSQPPSDRAATVPLGLYPGQRIDFVGRLSPDRRSVARAAIMCCRADAQTLALRLDRAAPFAPGAWVDARGTAVVSETQLMLRVDSIAAVMTPADPFMYL